MEGLFSWSSFWLVIICIVLIFLVVKSYNKKFRENQEQLDELRCLYVKTIMDEIWFPLQDYLRDHVASQYQEVEFLPPTETYVISRFRRQIATLGNYVNLPFPAETLMALRAPNGLEIGFDLDVRRPGYLIVRILPPKGQGEKFHKFKTMSSFDRSDVLEFITAYFPLYGVEKIPATV